MNVLDTRDLQERLEELEEMEELNTDEQIELVELQDMADEIPEWIHGEALIDRHDWIDYVQELLEDCGDIPSDLPHYIHIDWESTARDIAFDYGMIEYQGTDYYYRNC